MTFQLPLPGDSDSYEREHSTNRSVERHHERIIHSPINPILHTLPVNDSIQQPTFVADKPITNELKLVSHDDPAEARRIRCKWVSRVPFSNICPTFVHFLTNTMLLNMFSRYCQEFFNDEFNRHCKYAPDCFKNALECMTLMKCARCMLYHCDISDPEGEMPQHPCECIPGESCFSKRFVIAYEIDGCFFLFNETFAIAHAPWLLIFVPKTGGLGYAYSHFYYHAYAFIRRAMDAIESESRADAAATSIKYNWRRNETAIRIITNIES